MALTNKVLGKIHQGDCIKGMSKLADESVQLAFADPPFNIGYNYDEYDDQLESEKYIRWSRQWLTEVFRVLDPAGSFWLAIGDEYAAELKLEAQQVGFQPRNWVIWYYTFGVHCKTKFTRSHAHLFYFVKNQKAFTFNPSEIAVPSARQLVYGDSRANPAGRMPDDTWILRPQDCVDGFTPDEDSWYFPRVAGTFKERAGFHGCQMPEQLLGRIIRSCSLPNDVVLDPFSGSATTLTVAKKYARQFVGFELSKEYAKLGRRRLDNACVGDPLEGAKEPKVSAPSTSQGKSRGKRPPAKIQKVQPVPLFDLTEVQSESEAILQSFSKANRGFSVDRLIADPILNEDFQQHCNRRSVPGSEADRNRFLFRLRKSGKLKRAGIETKRRTVIPWDKLELFVFAAEIAWRKVSERYAQMSLDDLLCDPRTAKLFDEVAQKFSPGHTALEYRWAALKLRKEGRNGKNRANRTRSAELGIRKFSERDVTLLTKIDFERIQHAPGIYALRNGEGKYLYAGETSDLNARLYAQFRGDVQRNWQEAIGDPGLLELFVQNVSSVSDARLARHSRLLNWYAPAWNHNEQLAA